MESSCPVSWKIPKGCDWRKSSPVFFFLLFFFFVFPPFSAKNNVLKSKTNIPNVTSHRQDSYVVSLCLVIYWFFALTGIFVRLLSLFAPSDVSFNSPWQHQTAINSASALRRSSGKPGEVQTLPVDSQTEHMKRHKQPVESMEAKSEDDLLDLTAPVSKETKAVCYNGTRRQAITARTRGHDYFSAATVKQTLSDPVVWLCHY